MKNNQHKTLISFKQVKPCDCPSLYPEASSRAQDKGGKILRLQGGQGGQNLLWKSHFHQHKWPHDTEVESSEGYGLERHKLTLKTALAPA